MTTERPLVSRNALLGVRVAISVSESGDLSRLGLASQHCELAVAELVRAILIAGGTVVYGGRLVPVGFTQIMFDEVARFADDREAVVVCVPNSEHIKLSTFELRRLEELTSSSVSIVCLDQEGNPVLPAARGSLAGGDKAEALSAMRRYVTAQTAARVVLGGRLSGQDGAVPGVLEEVMMSLEAKQPVYVAGGFGGAGLAAARALHRGGESWGPAALPEHGDKWAEYMTSWPELEAGARPDGLDDSQRHHLAVTHRPADVAALTVLGLSRASI